METTMTEEEVEQHREAAEEIERYDYVNDESEDDCVNAVLYKTKDGRYFRYIEMTGMNSSFGGGFGEGTWLTGDAIEKWKEFYP